MASHSPASEERPLMTPTSDDTTVMGDPEGCIEGVPNGCAGPDTAPIHSPTAPKPRHAMHVGRPVLAPHVVILFGDRPERQSAWGRQGVARMGYHAFAKMLFDAYILHPSYSPPWEFRPFQDSDYKFFKETYNLLKNDFVAKVRMVPHFAVPSSASDGWDEDSLFLQVVGWNEMIQNTVSIHVKYAPPEDYPGKYRLQQLLRKRGVKPGVLV
ncbi:hypothetical protein BV20DRAFT_1044306 [Pilatotrama ljubarskyi]|nr:hypothetical protein BV20DRAFT_1044306 [Pilatotrama ljubarskyi]